MWAPLDCFCVVQLKENQSFAAFRPSDMNIMLIECQPFEIEVFKHLTSLTDGVPVLYMMEIYTCVTCSNVMLCYWVIRRSCRKTVVSPGLLNSTPTGPLIASRLLPSLPTFLSSKRKFNTGLPVIKIMSVSLVLISCHQVSYWRNIHFDYANHHAFIQWFYRAFCMKT